MNDMKIFSIGKIVNNDETVCIKLDRNDRKRSGRGSHYIP